MGHYVQCPFYVSDRRLSISCEDIYRRHDSKSAKHKWMRGYCDKAWESCPYARNLSDVYNMKGAELNKELDKLRVKELQAEQRKLMSRIGVLEKKEQKYQERIQNLQAIVQKYKDRERTVSYQIDKLASMYEGFITYLLSVFSMGEFRIENYENWSKDKEFQLLATERDEEGKPMVFKAIVRKVKDEADR